MSVSSFIARRYFTGSGGMFVSLLSAIAIIGVGLGVFALILVMSVMFGFSRDLEQKLMGFNAHIMVFAADPGTEMQFKDMLEFLGKNVAGSAAVVEGEGIIEVAGSPSAAGVKIRGMDSDDLKNLKGVEWHHRSDEALDAANSVIVGSELAYQLAVHPDFGDKVTLVAPMGRIAPTGELVPSTRSFEVSGIFRSGYFEYDGKIVITSRKAARSLLGSQATNTLHIWLANRDKAVSLADEARIKFPSLKMYTWETANRKLFAALRLERIAMTGLLALIIIIACISVISVIFMYVFAKQKDIAILSAIGASQKNLKRLFINIGAYIGLVGTSIGLACAVAVCLLLEHKKIMLPESYYLDHLPVFISWPFVVIVAFFGVVLTMAAALYPALQVLRFLPASKLRYE